MAEFYLKSSATGSANGSSWANAFTTLASAIVAMSAGDTLYISPTHDETTASAVTYTFPGTVASPNQVLCVQENTPPTTVTTGAIIKTTQGANGRNMTIRGSVYVQGVEFAPSWNAPNAFYASLNLADAVGNRQIYKNCVLNSNNHNHSSSRITIASIGNSSGGSVVRLDDCTIRTYPGTSAGGVEITGEVLINGGEYENANSALFIARNSSTRGVRLQVRGMSMTSAGASSALLDITQMSPGQSYDFINCSVGSGVAFTTGTQANPGGRARFYSVDSAGSVIRSEEYTMYGSSRLDTAVYLTGGATDGTTPHSMRLATNSNANEENPYRSQLIAIWNETVDSPITVSMEFLQDAAANANNSALWIDVFAMTTAGSTTTTRYSTRRATILTTPSALTTSAASWVQSMSQPKPQKCSVTLTPRKKGFIYVEAFLGSQNAIVYANPAIDVT